MQVAFAIQAVVDTSNSEHIKVFALEEEIAQRVPRERIMQGQSFSDQEKITGVELSAHAYKPITETLDAYDSTESGTGTNIFIKFSEPLHDLAIVNGEIVSSGDNYAVINADEDCILTGQKYEHTTQIRRKNDPLILAGQIEKIVTIDSATLISDNNVDKVLEKCYNDIVNTNTIDCKIVVGKHVNYGENGEADTVTLDKDVKAGDLIEVETEYLGTMTGRVINQTFNLNGNIVIKNSTLKRYEVQ
jgi:hypothetical protein